jgi:hypothetical protein
MDTNSHECFRSPQRHLECGGLTPLFSDRECDCSICLNCLDNLDALRVKRRLRTEAQSKVKAHISSTMKAHLIRGAVYILLLAVCVIRTRATVTAPAASLGTVRTPASPTRYGPIRCSKSSASLRAPRLLPQLDLHRLPSLTLPHRRAHSFYR